VIRYQSLETVLEFLDGRIHTEALSLDGPRIGVLASGDVELMSEDKSMDVRVALFLFRKLDRVIGMIPILNQLLLGTDASLIAAYFQMTGPWANPEVKQILLPGSAGPASVVLQGVPLFVKRGFQVLGSLVRPAPSKLGAPPPAESASPSEGSTGPSEESASPSEGSTGPSEESASPSEGSTGPSEGSTSPSEGGP
jgi:hypothetical protein